MLGMLNMKYLFDIQMLMLCNNWKNESKSQGEVRAKDIILRIINQLIILNLERKVR